MRISLWPALVCGSMLAAVIGSAVHAAPPTEEPTEDVNQADAVDDFNSRGDSSNATQAYGGFNPYQQIQYAQNGPGSPEGGGFAPGPGGFDPAMTAPNAWPQTSPYSQDPRQETFNSGGLWQYNSADDSTVKRFI